MSAFLLFTFLCTQVLFDGGLWFVGVVAALERDAYGDATAAVMLFEGNQSMTLVAACRLQIVIKVVLFYSCGWDFGDLISPVLAYLYLFRTQDGDRVRVPLTDPTIELLPQEWSDHVEKKKKWDWWGYTKDRVRVAMTQEGADAPVAMNGAATKKSGRQPVAKKGAGRGGAAENGGNAAKETKSNSDCAPTSGSRGRGKRSHTVVNGNMDTAVSPEVVAAAAEDALSREVTVMMEQMRGAETGFYLGCPVEVKVAGGAWVKGSVVSSRGCNEKSGNMVTVRLASGENVNMPTTTESGQIRFDHDACGKVEVGRHMQLLFDGGLWYIGVVTDLKLDDAGNVTQARTLFEDGEDTWVDWPDPVQSTALMTVEWTSNVSRACRWGWWGFNTDRVRHINKKLRGKLSTSSDPSTSTKPNPALHAYHPRV